MNFFHKDKVTRMDVTDERNFVRFAYNKGISTNAIHDNPRAMQQYIMCKRPNLNKWPITQIVSCVVIVVANELNEVRNCMWQTWRRKCWILCIVQICNTHIINLIYSNVPMHTLTHLIHLTKHCSGGIAKFLSIYVLKSFQSIPINCPIFMFMKGVILTIIGVILRRLLNVNKTIGKAYPLHDVMLYTCFEYVDTIWKYADTGRQMVDLRFNTLWPRQNGRQFADDIFKSVFLIENARISINISLKVVPKVQIINIPALVQIMAWRRSGDKPLSEPMMLSLLTYICVTRPQWVN